MTTNGWLQIGVFFALVLLGGKAHGRLHGAGV